MTQEKITETAELVANRICLDQLDYFYPMYKESGMPLRTFCKECYEEIEAWGNMYSGTKMDEEEVETVFETICKDICSL